MKLRSFIAFIAALFAGCTAFVFTDLIHTALPSHPDFSRFWIPLFTLACLGVPIATALLTFRLISGRTFSPLTFLNRLSRTARIGLLALYLFTWAFGVPAVISASHADAVAAYKRNREEDNRVSESHPWSATAAGFPVLPGVIVTFHEYQVAGLHGWGGWQVHLWYWAGSRELVSFTHWIS